MENESSNYLALLFARKDFQGENLNDIDLRNLDFRGCRMSGVFLDGSDLSESNLEGCDLYSAYLEKTKFINANLSKACLQGANLSHANLSGANLNNADFSISSMGRATNLSGVIFLNCQIENANFEGAIYDANTVFPTLFDPKMRGLKQAV